MRRASDWPDAKNGVVKKRRRTRSKFRFEVPDGFRSPRGGTWSDCCGRYRAWHHKLYPVRVVRFISSIEDREHWYVQGITVTPTKAVWENVDDFTRPAPAFREAVRQVKRLAREHAARVKQQPR